MIAIIIIKKLELVNTTEITPDKALTKLLELSGFPEPFLSGNKNEYHKRQKTHLDIILKQDLFETESVQHIKSIELLIELMTDRIASPLSYNSLREDLGTMLEAKLSDSNFDQDFSIFEKQTGSIPKYLLVKNFKKKDLTQGWNYGGFCSRMAKQNGMVSFD